MNFRRVLPTILVLAFLAACGGGNNSDPVGPNEGREDVGTDAEAAEDTSGAGSSQPDTGTHDAGNLDSGNLDIGTSDAAEPDAAEPDAAEPDAAEPDAAEPDAAEPDADGPITLTPAPTRTMTAANQRSCAIRDDGKLACWGDGQNLPEMARFTGNYVEVAMTAQRGGCVRGADGSIACSGAMFDAATAGVVPTPSGTGYANLVAGERHACAISTADQRIHCWGTAIPGEGTFDIPDIQAHDLAAGNGVSCAIDLDGAVQCWGGSGSYPVLTGGPFVEVDLSSTNILCARKWNGQVLCSMSSPPETERYSRLGLGLPLCGIRVDGTLHCWAGSTALQAVPQGTFTNLAVSNGHACARQTDGQWQCWGSNGFWESLPPVGGMVQPWLGNGTCIEFAPDQIECAENGGGGSGQILSARPANAGQLTGLAIAREHACGLDATSKAVCWGVNYNGQATAPQDKSFVSLATVEGNSCGLASDGSVTCWGGSSDNNIAGPYTSICATYNGGCGIQPGGNARCWGSNTGVPPSDTSFSALACGGKGACGIKTDGTIACWGNPNDASILTNIPAGSFVDLVNFEDSNACALRADGTLACWGWDPNSKDLFAVPDLRFSKVWTGWSSSCGKTTDGRVACWGAVRRTPLD